MKVFGLCLFALGLMVLLYGVVERTWSVGIARIFSEDTELYFQFSTAVLVGALLLYSYPSPNSQA